MNRDNGYDLPVVYDNILQPHPLGVGVGWDEVGGRVSRKGDVISSEEGQWPPNAREELYQYPDSVGDFN